MLAISFLVDGWVLMAAVRAVHASKGSQPFWKFVRSSSDPTVLAVLFEDFIACLGVVVATVGILISYYTGSPVFDAVSSRGWKLRELRRDDKTLEQVFRELTEAKTREVTV